MNMTELEFLAFLYLCSENDKEILLQTKRWLLLTLNVWNSSVKKLA